MSAYPALVITIPLLATFVGTGCYWLNRKLCYPVALLGLAGSLYTSVCLLIKVMAKGSIGHYHAGWTPPWGIEYRVDLLNSFVLVIIGSVALINLVASYLNIEQEMSEKSGIFYPLYLLFVTGLSGVVITGDLFNLYVLLEVTSLSAYALIAMGSKDRAPLASLNYVFIGVIGASFFLLGTGYLYIMTGSLNMVNVGALLPELYSSQAILVGFVFCIIGVWIKMAFFPLHVWLPNAYTYAPIAASRVIAPLMTKAMVYVMIRLMLTVFRPEYIYAVLDLQNVIVWLSCLAIVAGAVMALAQKNVMKMLTYIIISEIGYMVGGAWLGNQAGMTGSVLHILNDALMTFCLFLAVGNIGVLGKGFRLDSLQGIFQKMPVTMACFVLGCLCIIGVPPTCGFFSKWYLLNGAIQAGHYAFLVALLLSSLVNVILFFRIFEIGFFEPMSHGHTYAHQSGGAIQEAPISMLVPLILVSFGLLVVGLYSGLIVQQIIVPFLT
ncbi:MAG TPA: proton-conducting transporter membrane subunit [Desulfohalobiaceae bacterium]|nr:proton-conducting transporter membrane subunit [Desulfohalobiaceae bacterium]